MNPYSQKGSDELSRKLSEFDNRGVGVGSSGIRNKHYNRMGPSGDGVRYKSNANNYELSEKAHLHQKRSVEHPNSVSNIELRNNARYRVESSKNMNVPDSASGYAHYKALGRGGN